MLRNLLTVDSVVTETASLDYEESNLLFPLNRKIILIRNRKY